MQNQLRYTHAPSVPPIYREGGNMLLVLRDTAATCACMHTHTHTPVVSQPSNLPDLSSAPGKNIRVLFCRKSRAADSIEARGRRRERERERLRGETVCRFAPNGSSSCSVTSRPQVEGGGARDAAQTRTEALLSSGGGASRPPCLLLLVIVTWSTAADTASDASAKLHG